MQRSDDMPTSEQNDFPLDHLHRFRAWCTLAGINHVTGWRWVRDGKAPIITRLSSKVIGVRHRHHLAWLAAHEQHNNEAA
jgi:predicted DNA-binding transcriptional regulator AlpA